MDGDLASNIPILADTLEHRNQARLPALLAAYKLGGVPVIDVQQQSAGTNGDGVGVPWSIVYAAAMVPNETARISLTDVARMLHIDGLDLQAVADDLVAGLRASLAKSTEATGAGPIALLVQEEAHRYNGIALSDPATTAAEVFVTVPTASLVVSAGILTALTANRQVLATAENTKPSGFGNSVPIPRETGAPENCEFDDAYSQWALWMVSKIAGGADLPGAPSWEGWFGAPIKEVLSKAAANAVVKVTEWVSTGLTLLTTIVAAMTFSASVRLKGGEPLVRTHSSHTRGAVDAILVTVSYDFGALRSDVANALNCVLFVLVMIGNSAALPIGGPVGAGVAVTIEGEPPGFGERLNDTDAFVELDTPLTADTDDTGTATFTVAGRIQKRDMPNGAESYEHTFTVAVSAKPDPTDVNSIVKTFLDSVLCVPGTAVKLSACADPFADVARQFNWDLGRWAFGLTDWHAGWAIHDSLHPEQSPDDLVHYDAVSCDSPHGPWHITVSFTQPGNVTQDVTFDVVLNDDGTGTVTGQEHSTWDDGLIVTGTSTGTAQLTKTGITVGQYELVLDYHETVNLDYPATPSLNTKQENHHIKTITVIPASNEECK